MDELESLNPLSMTHFALNLPVVKQLDAVLLLFVTQRAPSSEVCQKLKNAAISNRENVCREWEH